MIKVLKQKSLLAQDKEVIALAMELILIVIRHSYAFSYDCRCHVRLDHIDHSDS